MATWKNLDTLASYSELKDLKDHVNIAEQCPVSRVQNV